MMSDTDWFWKIERPEIALQQVRKVPPEPDVPGLIESQRRPQLGDVVRRRLLAQQDRRRVARDQEEQREGDDHHSRRHRHEECQSPDDVVQHPLDGP